MRPRITGRRLLPAALAAASVLAVAAPASALQAPPDPIAHDERQEDCARALKVLSILRLLPNKPDVAKALCSSKESRQPGEYGRDAESVERGDLFGLTDLPESLTIPLPDLGKRPDAHKRGDR
ncbi:hypothetical protein AGRA3207_001688 [Actinomadura graeca]|uniref:Secreted protein n=1 Tax=Actinomadura graeca TaxID=2750812 RepID=A0ABX8QQ18_9ACTN|nr:hypothetical protein [Actinomadura graeca]QXJ20894.1 hypothetical protein AGRA3207_001688 [Actinomadura graeca]